MAYNYLTNSNWLEHNQDGPLYYTSLGLLHFDQRQLNGYRLASLQLGSNELERLTYSKFIEVGENEYLTIGLILRGNDVQEFNYLTTFYNENQQVIKQMKQNVVSEITPQFKTICVTYKIPSTTQVAKVGWEVKGCATGMTLYKPFVNLK